MEGLGRLFNVIPVASGEPFKMRGASSAMIVMTGSSGTVTMQQQPGFGGSPVTFLCIKNVYWSTQSNGTAAWNKFAWNIPVAYPTPAALATYTHGTTTGLTTAVASCFTIFSSEMSDPENYVVATGTNSGLIQVILGDLVSQRNPANLEILAS